MINCLNKKHIKLVSIRTTQSHTLIETTYSNSNHPPNLDYNLFTGSVRNSNLSLKCMPINLEL